MSAMDYPNSPTNAKRLQSGFGDFMATAIPTTLPSLPPRRAITPSGPRPLSQQSNRGGPLTLKEYVTAREALAASPTQNRPLTPQNRSQTSQNWPMPHQTQPLPSAPSRPMTPYIPGVAQQPPVPREFSRPGSRAGRAADQNNNSVVVRDANRPTTPTAEQSWGQKEPEPSVKAAGEVVTDKLTEAQELAWDAKQAYLELAEQASKSQSEAEIKAAEEAYERAAQLAQAADRLLVEGAAGEDYAFWKDGSVRYASQEYQNQQPPGPVTLRHRPASTFVVAPYHHSENGVYPSGPVHYDKHMESTQTHAQVAARRFYVADPYRTGYVPIISPTGSPFSGTQIPRPMEAQLNYPMDTRWLKTTGPFDHPDNPYSPSQQRTPTPARGRTPVVLSEQWATTNQTSYVPHSPTGHQRQAANYSSAPMMMALTGKASFNQPFNGRSTTRAAFGPPSQPLLPRTISPSVVDDNRWT